MIVLLVTCQHPVGVCVSLPVKSLTQRWLVALPVFRSESKTRSPCTSHSWEVSDWRVDALCSTEAAQPPLPHSLTLKDVYD
jgi:hypothetical protein